MKKKGPRKNSYKSTQFCDNLWWALPIPILKMNKQFLLPFQYWKSCDRQIAKRVLAVCMSKKIIRKTVNMLCIVCFLIWCTLLRFAHIWTMSPLWIITQSTIKIAIWMSYLEWLSRSLGFYFITFCFSLIIQHFYLWKVNINLQNWEEIGLIFKS